ncbi:MAG: nucleotide exchange factor GrpE [Betaproteobacteria bacterium]|nr:nucleotide exchange factor GrpE [Betaproteobacteria bacterium]
MKKKIKSPAKTGKSASKPKTPETSGNSETAAADAPAAEKTAAPADPLAAYDAAALRDLYLRAAAEKENTLKRAEAEIKKARDFALNHFSRGICEVRDCLESAMSGGEKTGEGVALTLKKLTVVMEANGIRPVRPDIGAPFDPELHMAIGFDSGGEHAANTIAAVVQCGYTLNGRVVRAAGVMVGKPADKPENN